MQYNDSSLILNLPSLNQPIINQSLRTLLGGQTIGQSLVSAAHTIPKDYITHSLHSYFLLPGNDDLPILYHVERLHDGTSFLTRRVTAQQLGRVIFAMSVSFHRPESGFEHQLDPPQVPSVSETKSMSEMMREWQQLPNVPEHIKRNLIKSAEMPFPIDIRRVSPPTIKERLVATGCKEQITWMRVNGCLRSFELSIDRRILHQCAIAYMSDWSLLETACVPHGIHLWLNSPQEYLQMASLDHAMYFHCDFRADEWLLYVMNSPRASQARGLAIGHFYDQRGQLIVTAGQVTDELLL